MLTYSLHCLHYQANRDNSESDNGALSGGDGGESAVCRQSNIPRLTQIMFTLDLESLVELHKGTQTTVVWGAIWGEKIVNLIYLPKLSGLKM